MNATQEHGINKKSSIGNGRLVKGLRDFVFGENGGASYADIEALSQRDSFAQFLPPLCFEQKKGFLNANNTVGHLWECEPLAFMGMKQVKEVENLLRGNYPKETVMQFMLYADHNIDDFSAAYVNAKNLDDPISSKSVFEYQKFLKEGTHGINQLRHIPCRNFRLIVSLYSKEIIPKDTLSIIEEVLTGVGLVPKRMNAEAYLGFIRPLLNGTMREKSPTHYTDAHPLNKQIINAETVIQFKPDHVEIGQAFARCLTPKSTPKMIDPLKLNKMIGGIRGPMDDTEQINSPFVFTVSILFDDMKGMLKNKASVVMSQKAGGALAQAIAKRIEEFGWAIDKLDSDKFVRIIPSFWLFDNDLDKLSESTARAKRMMESLDFVVQQETDLQQIMLIAALPFGLYTDGVNVQSIDRHFIYPASTVARFLPLQGEFRGSPNPVLSYIGRKGQVIGLDVFDRRSNNHNYLVSAESGSGKSFSLNYLCCNYYNAGSKVRIIDLGYSYQKLCRTVKGRFMDFGEEKVVINPFYTASKTEEDKRGDEIVASNILAEMAYSASGASLHETEWSLLKDAVSSIFQSGDIDQGIDGVCHYLKTVGSTSNNDLTRNARDKALELAFNLKDFSSTGRYGDFFNGKSTFDISQDDFVVLELDRLKGMRELFSVVIMQVMNSVTQDLYLSDRGDQRFILFEEAASFLKKSGHTDLSRLAAIIEEGYRRARKYRGSFGVVLQSILDTKSFGDIGDVLINNSAYKFYLEGKDYQKAVVQGHIHFEGLALDMLDSVKNNKPNYSELFIETPFGVGVGRLVVDPFTYWLSTSDGNDVAKINSLIDKGIEPYEALCQLSGVSP